ncbi:MAG: hypothetical protein J7521_11080 [Caulobacter sp.]|nr:hypothetical protein [Caulobacter sp.]
MTSLFPEIELPKIDPEKGPNFVAGVSSPLWLVFGGAAVAGATWWWWSSRWREAVNVEALMSPAAAAPGAVIDPVTEAPAALKAKVPEPVEVVAEIAVEVVETAADTTQAVLDTVEASVVETVQAATPAVEAAADDLTLLVGIGPKLAASLGELGVTRFEQIAAWGPDELARFDGLLSLRGRAERDAWVAQAKRLTSGT